jgi:hypothetical protein
MGRGEKCRAESGGKYRGEYFHYAQ